jgi:hypothetical protein
MVLLCHVLAKLPWNRSSARHRRRHRRRGGPPARLTPSTELGRLRGGRAGWCTGDVTGGSSTRHTFCVCLLAMDQLSVDDRRCRPVPRRS